MRLHLIVPLFAVASACGGGSETPAPDAAPPMACREAPPLGDGPWFTEITDEVGLGRSGLAVDGNRITIVDLDGDGWNDLVTHQWMQDRPMLDVDPPVLMWRILLNRPAPGGGGGRIFEDVSIDSGYGLARDGSMNRAANLAVAADFDNDGDADLLSGYYADVPDFGDRNELFLNDGAAHFTRARGGVYENDLPWHTAAAAPLDYDRDGFLDVYLGFWYNVFGLLPGQQDRLYRGDGAGGLMEVTDAAGLTTTVNGYAEGTNHRPTYGLAACDMNDDGWPDLLGSAYGREWNQLWVNGSGTFMDVGRATGYAADEITDYSDNEFYRCWCQQNPGGCDPSIPGPRILCDQNYWNVGVDDQPWMAGGNTFTTACGDVDNDGDLDLYNSEIVHWHIGGSSDPSQLLVNEPNQSAIGFGFVRPGVAATGLGIPHPTQDWNEGGIMTSFIDFDNDGSLDIYLAASEYAGNFGLLYRGNGDGTFTEASDTAGVHQVCANGIAVGDLDNDGDQDLILGSGTWRDCADTWTTAEVHVYRNDVGQETNALRLRLVGSGPPGAARDAIGARVKVTAGATTFRRDVQGSYGTFAIGNELPLTVGLGSACTADVEVRWPDAQGTVETYPGVLANYAVEITQGAGVTYREALTP
jgi:enediyne biosynthesis protein E4